jgi:hypothetical protein
MGMARGWESKSVEGQVDEFKSKAGQKRKHNLTQEQAGKSRQREVLLLARARVQHELEVCYDPRRQEQLKRALAHLDEQLDGSSPATDSQS